MTEAAREYEGQIQFLEIEGGVWILATDEGDRLPLFRAPAALLKEGLSVTISGRLNDEVMNVAQIGPVLEVLTFAIPD
ncbi:MAG: hypothetical protein AAFY57_00195 [Cyanobacteria bacterium J06642_2]